MPHPPWVTLLVLSPAILNLAEGCYRKAAQRVTPPPPPATTVDPSYKEKCSLDEEELTRCINGECFAVTLNDRLRSVGCSCNHQWIGNRCQFRYIDPDLLEVRQENMRTAHIAAGVSVCILIVFVVLLAVYVYVRINEPKEAKKYGARRKDRNQNSRYMPVDPESSAGHNGTSTTPDRGGGGDEKCNTEYKWSSEAGATSNHQGDTFNSEDPMQPCINKNSKTDVPNNTNGETGL